MKKIIQLSVICLCVLRCLGEPELFFGYEDIPAIRERIKTPEYAYVWEKDIEVANNYLDPDSKAYLDVDKFIEQWHRSGWYDRMIHSRVEILGFASLITGETKYAEVAVDLLEKAAIKQDVSAEQMVPHRAYAMGLDWCGDYMSEQQKKLITDAAANFARHKSRIVFSEDTWWYPYHNWIGVDIGAAGLIALKLRNEYPDESQIWIARCNEALKAWFRNAFDRNGGQVEGTQYYAFGFTNALRYGIALKRITGEDIFADSGINNLPNFLAMSLIPGEGEFDARNDAHYGGVGYVVATMYNEVFGSSLMAWLRENACDNKFSRDYTYPRGTPGYVPQRLVWSKDVKPLSPEQLGIKKGQFFPQRGLAIWRTGWEKEDIMFSMEAGPYYAVTHNQADKGHFTLYGLGYRWAPDPGYGNNREPQGRSQTDGHNCILINGKGQMLSGAALGTNGNMVRWYDHKSYGYCLTDSTEAYNKTIAVASHESSQWWKDVGDGDKNSLERDLAKHVYRHSLFVKKSGQRPAYVVMFDDVTSFEDKTDYTWQMITWPNIEFSTQENMITLRPVEAKADSPRLELYVDTVAGKTIAVDIYEPGDNRKPVSYPRLRVNASEIDNPKFISILLPLESDVVSPDVQFLRKEDNSAIVTISWANGYKETISCPFADRFEPVITFSKPQHKSYAVTEAVRPGKIDEQPFWNNHSFTFTYAPSFEFGFVDGASEYVFAVTSSTKQVHRFTAKRPDASLSPIWEDIVTGEVSLKVVGIDDDGEVVGVSGERIFHKAAEYTGNYRDENYDYGESAREALQKLFELDYIRYWLDHDQPDPDYYDPVVGYQYAAKIISAVVDGAAMYYSLEPKPKDADEVLEIGIKAGDYLLSRHFPNGYALADFPPTYDKMETRGHMSEDNAMPMYGAEAGRAYLKLFKITGEDKYFIAAEKIADGFKRLQLDNGSWYLMVNVKTGEPVYDNYINPQDVVEYLEIFIDKYGRKDLQSVVDKAIQWTFDNPMKNFNWQNQFEDSVPTDAYKNLSHGQAVTFARYLFKNYADDPEKVKQAKELLRFVEDQFIVWSDPPQIPERTESYWPAESYSPDNWLFPCVCEQYLFWQPVNASSAKTISAFVQAYKATGEEIYLNKAKDLADTIVYAQKTYNDGSYKTYLITLERDFWVNCATYTAKTMLEFDDFLKDL